MTDRPGFPVPAPTGRIPGRISECADKEWVRAVSEAVARVLGGKMNAVLDVTLPDGAASTTVIDARIGAFTMFVWEPLTANAAALLWAAPYVVVASQQEGEATFDHANTANADQDFRLLMIG